MGYAEQIVEIAVKYNVDSNHTSFLAINERENKLFGVPEQEQVALENPEAWEMPVDRIAREALCYRAPNLPVGAFCESSPIAMSRPRNRRLAFAERKPSFLTEVVCKGSKTTLHFDDGTVKVVVIGKDIEMDSPLVQAILGKYEGEEVYYIENGIIYHVIIRKVENLGKMI